jgi:hypothetical protein
VNALPWPLFARSEWVQSSTEMAGRTSEGSAQASVRYVDVVLATHCGGEHDR